MESAAVSGNSAKLIQLIPQTGSKGIKVSEVIEEKDGSLISNQKCRMERWAEHFQSHFSNCQQPQPDSHSNTLPVSVWTVSNEPPTETKFGDAIKRLKLRRAAGPDDLPPVLFKTGSATLIRVITQLFESIWQSESVPESWDESTVIPIFKKDRKTV